MPEEAGGHEAFEEGREALSRFLRDRRKSAGEPSLRFIASRAGCSHTTVSKALSGKAVPSWTIVSGICKALDADDAAAKPLWIWANSGIRGTLPPPVPGPSPSPGIHATHRPTTALRPFLPTGMFVLVTLCVMIFAILGGTSTDNTSCNRWIGEVGQLVCGATTCVLLLTRPRRTSVALWTAGAVAAWTTGALTWFVLNSGGSRLPTGTLADVGYLAMPALMIPALWLHARRSGAITPESRGAVAALAVIAAMSALSFTWFFLSLSGKGAVAPWVAWINYLYPMTDTVLLTLAASLLTTRTGLVRPLALVVAFAALMISDEVYVQLADRAAPHTPFGTTLGYLIFSAALLVAVAEADGEAPGLPEGGRAWTFRPGLTLLLQAWGLMSIGVCTYVALNGPLPTGVPVPVFIVMVMALAAGLLFSARHPLAQGTALYQRIPAMSTRKRRLRKAASPRSLFSRRRTECR